MAKSKYWSHPGGSGQVQVKALGLGYARPIMVTTLERGECKVRFESDHEHHVWNEIACIIWRIKAPSELEEISSMHAGKDSALAGC